MRDGPDVASVAALIAEPARAAMLSALMDGRAFTAGELAREAGVMPQTASGHLAKLVEADLLVAHAQGRHRYFALAGPAVSAAIEHLMTLASVTGRNRTRPGPRDAQMRRSRVCYDHLAGDAAVRMLDRLLADGLVESVGETGLTLTPGGSSRFRAEGIDPSVPPGSRRPLCRTCLDWSERRPHLAGLLGARLLTHMLEQHWCRRDGASRAVVFSPQGASALERFPSAP